MKSTRSLAVASILVLSLATVFVACGSDDPAPGGPGDGVGGSGASTGGGAADGGGDEWLMPDGNTWDVPTGEASPLDGSEVCAGETVAAKRVPANILFVVDRTGSMNCNAPPTQTTAECDVSPKKKDGSLPSKWEITRDALSAAIQGLETTVPLPAVGMLLFNNNDLCGIPDVPHVLVESLTGDPQNDPQLNHLLIELGNVVPKGETPIVGGTMRAYDYFHKNAASFTGNKFVVLLTDGAETCDADNKPFLVQKAAEAAENVGIRTFVMGAPGSESERAFLSQIAFAGGTPSSAACDHSGAQADQGDCHMDMTLPGMNFAQVLTENLDKISGEALSCEFDVPAAGDGGSVDYGKVNVKYSSGDGEPEYIGQDKSTCSDPENKGWQYAESNTKIVLCGEACERVKNDPNASISIELGCTTVDVPK